jgi:hypothetical protein
VESFLAHLHAMLITVAILESWPTGPKARASSSGRHRQPEAPGNQGNKAAMLSWLL